MQIARNAAQASRLTAEAEEELSWKVDGIAVLTKAEAAERIRFDAVVAAYHNPHCARIQPAQLARGLADTVERLGVDIYEQSPVTAIDAGKATTPHGTVTAPVVLRATEGFTARLPGLRRRWLPMNSSMIATDPISDDLWDEHRLARPRDGRQRRARLLLRAADRRQPHRDRRPERARTATHPAPTSTGGCPNGRSRI